MIGLSKAAIREISRLKSACSESAYLRLSTQMGGCAHYLYTLSFDEVLQEGDQIFSHSPIQVVINSDCLPYLNGLFLDYSEDLIGGAFRFHNPNATYHCGCGNSFATTAPNSAEKAQCGDRLQDEVKLKISLTEY
jgi:iron-sulfur cluster assembly accessory protein